MTKPNFSVRVEMQDGRFAAICGGFVSLGDTPMEAINGLESTGTITRMGWNVEIRSRAAVHQLTQEGDRDVDSRT